MTLNLTSEQQEILKAAMDVAGARCIVSHNDREDYIDFVLDIFKSIAVGDFESIVAIANAGYQDEAERVELFDSVGGQYGERGIMAHETPAERQEHRERERIEREEQTEREAQAKVQKIRTEGKHMVFYTIRHDDKSFAGFDGNMNKFKWNKYAYQALRFGTAEEAKELQERHNIPGQVMKADRYYIVSYGSDYDFTPVN